MQLLRSCTQWNLLDAHYTLVTEDGPWGPSSCVVHGGGSMTSRVCCDSIGKCSYEKWGVELWHECKKWSFRIDFAELVNLKATAYRLYDHSP